VRDTAKTPHPSIRPLSWVALGLSLVLDALWVLYGYEQASDFINDVFGEYSTAPIGILIILQLAGAAIATFAGSKGGGNRVVGVIAGVILLAPFYLVGLPLPG
jgi:hypothetical protein